MIQYLQSKTLLQTAATLLLIVSISACATLSGREGPSVRVVGLEPLPSEGLELRFALKLRVQNPNETALAYDGLSVTLDLDGRGVASGVSDVTGEIPRFSDALLSVPVSISAFSVFRQMLARVGDANGQSGALSQPIAYSMKGKLGGVSGSLAARFGDKGEMDLFASANADETDNVNTQ